MLRKSETTSITLYICQILMLVLLDVHGTPYLKQAQGRELGTDLVLIGCTLCRYEGESRLIAQGKPPGMRKVK